MKKSRLGSPLGAEVAAAQRRAYQLVVQIGWDGGFHRSDIGHRAIAREKIGNRGAQSRASAQASIRLASASARCCRCSRCASGRC